MSKYLLIFVPLFTLFMLHSTNLKALCVNASSLREQGEKPFAIGASSFMDHSTNHSLKSLDGEVWQHIKGYEESYMVSNFARIKSLKREFYINTLSSSRKPIVSIRRINARILRQSFQKCDGRKVAQLTSNGKMKAFKVARLVAIAFVPNPENKPETNHIDGNRLNDNATNLEWSTHSENMLHAFRLNLIPRAFLGLSGKLHHSSVKVHSVSETGETTFYEGISDAARILGVTKVALSNALCGRSQTCKKMKWFYTLQQNSNIIS